MDFLLGYDPCSLAFTIVGGGLCVLAAYTNYERCREYAIQYRTQKLEEQQHRQREEQQFKLPLEHF